MNDLPNYGAPEYQPDIVLKKRNQPSLNPSITVDKPIRFRVTVRQATKTKHYPKKERKPKNVRDPRDVTFY